MPKDFDRLVVRLRQFGGWRLVWQYARMGVLWTGIAELMCCLVGRRSVKEVYPAVMKRVENRLLRKYGTVLHDAYRRHASQDLSGEKPKVVWTCWLQGEQEAPELVKACWESVRRNMGGHELRIVTEKNYRTWVELPEHVVRKYERGVIPPAMFSDLLRLELLVRHGGTWLDATVLCSGFGNEGLRERWAAIERSELCLFRYFQRGRREAVGLSNWFISARPGNAVLAAVRDALFEHWKDYDCVVDYYVCHLFLGRLLAERKEVADGMPRENSFHSILLGRALNKAFNQEAWEELTAHVSFHKLNYRKARGAAGDANDYLQHILEEYR